MALNTQISDVNERDHLLLLRPVGSVTAETHYRVVFVPRVLVLFTDRMCRVVRPVVAGAAKVQDRGLIPQKAVIGRMGIMTVRTVPVLYRRMLRLGTVLSLDRVFVARAAEGFHRFFQKIGLSRRMRVMAVETASLAHNGPVHPVFVKNFIYQIAVASQA